MGAVAPGQAVLGPDDLTILSTGDGDLVRDPVVAARAGEAAAAWSALVEGRVRIIATRRTDDTWSAPFLLDESVEGDCSQPLIEYAPDGTAGIVWVQSVSEMGTLYYRTFDSAPQIVSVAPIRVESPSLAYGEDGLPIVAWSEGGGGRFAVIVAQQRTSGAWTRTVLSVGLDAYDILPYAFGGRDLRVYWYGLDGQSFSLRTRQWDGADWTPHASGLQHILPANRLPYLYDTQTTLGPGAVWVEPMAGGEVALTADPRHPAELPVQPLPGATDARQLEPDATSNPRVASFAWREETAAGSDLLVLRDNQLFRVTGIPHMTQPRLADDGEGGLHLVFVSDPVEGGTGRVYWTHID